MTESNPSTVLSREGRAQFSLEGKVALLTGASRGIGAAIARAFAAQGAHVVVSSRKLASCEEVAQSIVADGGKASALQGHLANMDQTRALVADTVALAGGLDIVVNNAATNPTFGPLLQTDEEAFDKIIAVNLKGPFELSKAAFPHMQERGGGVVINISSIGGISPEPMLGIYSVSKAALVSLTQSMAKEWGPSNVRVNAICPGLVRTKFSSAIWTNDDLHHDVVKDQPLPRMAEPEEIAGTAVWLASEAGRYVTGAVIPVDGGHTI